MATGGIAVDERTALIDALRRHKPARVEVQTVEGETRKIQVPATRKKWDRLADTLESFRWTRCDLLTARGEVISCIDATEDDEDEAPPPGKPLMVDADRYAESLRKHVREVLGPFVEMANKAIGALHDVVELQGDAHARDAREKEELYQGLMRARQALLADNPSLDPKEANAHKLMEFILTRGMQGLQQPKLAAPTQAANGTGRPTTNGAAPKKPARKR